MKELRFRWWDEKTKKMEYLHHGKFLIFASGKWVVFKDGELRGIDPLLFTGLSDRSGNDVYKDDLIRNDSGRIGRVVWFIWGWDVKLVKSMPGDNYSGFDPPAWSSYVEVIGNTHENKDLMEDKK